MNHPSLIVQLLSLLGALLCLVAYVGHQWNWLDTRKIPYNLLNIVGSGILAYIAMWPFQAGFLVMEVVWATVSIAAFYKSLVNRVSKGT